MVLNKADLLHEELRSAWADKFDDMGVKYLFWAEGGDEKIERDAILEKRTRSVEVRGGRRGELRSTKNSSSSSARMKGRKKRRRRRWRYRRRRRRPR